jgi:diguanylate cyclase (GGDEF)-like protein/PAS domain S-box-containing protein
VEPALRRSAIMATESIYPAPFDASTFIFPAEWHALSEAFGGSATGLLFLHDGLIVHLNNNLEEQLGYDDAELAGRPIESLLLPETNSEFHPDEAGGSAADMHGRVIRLASKSGKPVTFHLITNRIDTLSNARYTIWVLQPPSKQAAAEAVRDNAAAAARREAIAAHLPNLVLVCAPDATLNYASHSFAELIGLEDVEAQGLRLIDVVHHDDRCRLRAALEQLAGHAGPASTIAFRVRRHDGSWRHIEAQASNLLAQPAVAGLLLSGRDVTDQAQQQRGIETNKKRQLHYLNRLLHLAQRPHPDLASALKVILKASAKALATHRCAYWETDDDRAATRCVLAYDDVAQNFVGDTPDARFATVLRPLLRHALSSEHAMVVADVDQDPRTALCCEYFHATGIKAVMIMPVRRTGGVAGLLMLSHFEQPRDWQRDESDFARNVAGLILLIFKEIERSRTAVQLRSLAHHDSGAGLPSQHVPVEKITGIFPRIAEHAAPLTVFFVDIDGVDHADESHDTAISDELRNAVALRLKSVLRNDDVLLQAGSDEFVLLACKLTDMRVAHDIAQQISDVMRDPFTLHGNELQIAASVGIARYPQDGTDVETLMQKAASALLRSQSTGRHSQPAFSSRGSSSSGVR